MDGESENRLTKEEWEELPKGKRYDIDDYMGFISRQPTRKAPPNVEYIEPEEFISRIASFGHSYYAYWGYAYLPDNGKVGGTSYSKWCQWFLDIRNGSGLGAAYSSIVFKFSICKHVSKLRPYDHPNHGRGWHPGVCSKCGLDMDIDSGD
jgi:hypothetical protein